MIESCIVPLFVPGHRIEILPKAACSGADALIVDLEDAVAQESKQLARSCLGPDLAHDVTVRINAIATEWFEADVASLDAGRVVGVVLPKTESADDIAVLRGLLPKPMPVVALIESGRGLENAGKIAEVAERIAFGSLDFAADLGCGSDAEPLLYARARLVLAARLAGKPAPIDGVTSNFRDLEACRADTVHAAKMGFGGRLCIHPSQVPIVLDGFRPSETDLAWARRVLAAADGAVAVDGAMVDAPVRLRARHILARAGDN